VGECKPKKPLRDDFYSQVPEGWVDAITDKEVTLCSASLLLAIRGRDRGARMMKLFILGKALRVWMTMKGMKPGPYLPLKWFRRTMKPFFPFHFKQAWQDAVATGLLDVDVESNSVTPVSAKAPTFWPKMFALLGMDPDNANEHPGGFDDIVWTTHTYIAPRFKDLLNPEWDDQRTKVALAAVFMWGLNHNDHFPSVVTFGKLFGVCGKTVQRWSKTSGEFAQRRCIPIAGAPWIPDWEMEDRPPQLQGVKRPILNGESPQFKLTETLLNKTRKWGENGHQTNYFIYRSNRKKASRLARRIPNHHKPKYGRKIRTEIPESGDWCPQKRRLQPQQYFQKPTEELRVWFNQKQFRDLVDKMLKERRWKFFEKLPKEQQAKFVDEIKRTHFNNFKDFAAWVQQREFGNNNVHTKEQLEELRMQLRKLNQPLKPMIPLQMKRDVIADVPENRRPHWEKYFADKEAEHAAKRDAEKTKVEKKIKMLEATAERDALIWKRTCLTDFNGEDRFGVNRFTTPIVPIYGTLESEMRRLFPGREIPKWSRTYGLGHRPIKHRKRIRCSSCSHTVSHLPHPQYHTSCPHCGENFTAGVTGLAL
jgi:hypothetical protein